MLRRGLTDTALDRLVSRTIRRRWLRHLATAAAAAAIASAGLAWTARPAVTIFVAALAALAVLVRTAKHRTRAAIVHAIEAARPSARNVVLTADELQRHPERAPAWIKARVLADAEKIAVDVPVGELASTRGTVLFTAIATGGVLLAVLIAGSASPHPLAKPLSRALSELGLVAGSPTVIVTLQPPAYTGLPVDRLENPSRVEALEGSRVDFEVQPAGASIRFGDKPVSSDFLARESGYFALVDDKGHIARLIVLAVLPDRAPTVRIDSPARDLLLPAADRRIPILLAAADDFALQQLELRFTKVSGSGEQFDFVEGTVPLNVERRSDREWRGSATLDLPAMKLGAGDSFVYRAVSRDRRPGQGGVGTSETYFVEIAGPGQVVLEGVEMPPELDRYAMSQQMIVLKLERLRAREGSMPRPALVEEAAGLAAEQRTVRANFVFLLGGHVEDEVEEAEQSHEIQEGRLENTARRDINTAIAHMTRAEQGMTAVDLAAALPPARAAVDALQRAFGKSRYLLRSLAAKSRIDPGRRLTGDTSGVGGWHRPPQVMDPGDRHEVIAVFEGILGLASAARSGKRLAAADFEQLAERALAIDPVNEMWQETSRVLLALSRSVSPSSSEAAARVEAVLSKVAAEVRRGALARSSGPDPSPLRRAYQAEQHR